MDSNVNIYILNILKDVPFNFKYMYFLSGMNKLDSIILKKTKDKESGFIIKFLSSKKIIENKDIKEYHTEMKIANIVSYNIPDEIFNIPKDYKKTALIINR